MDRDQYRIEFVIKGLPATTNSLGRAHWTRKAKEAKLWKRRVHAMVLVSKVGFPPKPLSKAKLTLIRYSSGECDHDGLVSSFKHVIDGLVECGVIENDKRGNIGVPTYLPQPAKRGKGMIRVLVEEI